MDKTVKLKKKILIIPLLVVALLVGLIGVASFGYSYHLYSEVRTVSINRNYVIDNNNDNKISKEESKVHNGITNIVLFGSDSYDSSDSIVILTIDEDKNKIKLSSIMRDSWVNIPSYGESIINASMAYGGPELELKTINTTFNLNLDKFINVDLTSLPKIIDKVGGLDFEIDSDELQYINKYIDSENSINNTNEKHLNSTGMQHFTGTQATAYCRIRYTEGTDFKRTWRQRKILQLIFDKLKTMGPSQINSFLDCILPLVETDLSYSDLVGLGAKISSSSGATVEENRFPNDGDHWSTWVDGGYRLNFDKETTAKKINEFIYG